MGISVKADKNNKAAILFYNKAPITFSAYTTYEIGTGYIALYEFTDNTYVLCRLLDDREVQPFGKSAHRLIIKLPDGSVQERYIIVIKQDIKDLSEVEKIVDGFRRAFLQLEKKGYQ